MELEEFTIDQIMKLRKLNDVLSELEKKIKEQAARIYSADKKIIEQSQGWIQDYEFECEISFWLSEDDPEYKEDVDNILATIDEPLEHHFTQNVDFGMFDGENHNLFCDREGHPLNGDFHCWLFHRLYDADLEWSDLLRIGSIWTDITVIFQNDHELNRLVV
jgi:hypothetical protein